MKFLAMIGAVVQLHSQNISHEPVTASFEAAKQALIDRVQERGDLPYASTQKQLGLIEQLSEFELGRFLIERAGLNGYWIHYAITNPGSNHPLEEYLLNHSPYALATRQRYHIFKREIQKHLTEGCSFASIPSGLMGDLIELDYSQLSSFQLHGIDLDRETLDQAKNYAERKGLASRCQFFERNAWDLNCNEQYDLIASNGLNIYEPDNQKVVALYRQFYQALKPGGILVTSFLTPPPVPGKQTEWKMDRVNLQDVLTQKLLFVDILSAKWQVFRAEEAVKAQLKEVGFSDVDIFYDDAHIFPTIKAIK